MMIVVKNLGFSLVEVLVAGMLLAVVMVAQIQSVQNMLVDQRRDEQLQSIEAINRSILALAIAQHTIWLTDGSWQWRYHDGSSDDDSRLAGLVKVIQEQQLDVSDFSINLNVSASGLADWTIRWQSNTCESECPSRSISRQVQLM
ncbi:type II secretion system protein [Celerinatantimonas sp. MCCC 1A17872]|uniref:type II secretion system protein n=1 Tax=Celerinatantimonas sp. MCCC 1A17872 TaxID=3177514 RepID=UPI0038C31B41